jgi:hypothetical protein
MHVYKDRLGTRMKDEAIVALVSDRSYAKRSFQSEIVARWKRLIPADQFALFFLDELVADPKALRARVISFVGGDPDKPSADLPPDFNRKEGKSSLPLSEQLGHMLAERLSDELKACADMFGGPAEDWPKRYGL